MRRVAASVVLAVVLLWSAAPASAQPAPYCRPGESPEFTFGFAVLAARLGPIVGEPIECAHPNDAGDVLQHTTTGLAFWRKATNMPTFTDGCRHWALGPRGIGYWEGTSIDPPSAAVWGDECHDPGGTGACAGVAPIPGPSPASGFGPFEGRWGRHGLSLTITPDGTGDAEWRTYQWCDDPGVTEPCDLAVGGIITGGGRAVMQLVPPGQDAGEGSTLRGTVERTTQPSVVARGPIWLRLGAYGTATLEQPDRAPITLCGPRYATEAPEWFRQTLPCGA
ncbi:MAG: hypothetical protein M3O34_03510 [Chloroflexota bacterium]|nr:hypothetical protein [Chloroflexota bacterium]